jgi:hypothetical protein
VLQELERLADERKSIAELTHLNELAKTSEDLYAFLAHSRFVLAELRELLGVSDQFLPDRVRELQAEVAKWRDIGGPTRAALVRRLVKEGR